MIYVLVAVVACSRVAYWFFAEPGSDEAYYWTWGQQLDLSYYDHPPWHAWAQRAATELAGTSLFSLRLANLLTSAATIALFYWIARRMSGPRGEATGPAGPDARARFGAIMFTVLSCPLMFVFTALATQDHWLVFFTLAAACCFLEVLDAHQRGRLGARATVHALLGGALLGLAALTKYLAFFLAVGLAVTIVVTPALRPLLRQWRLYAAALVCLLVMSPALVWNFQHAGASLSYHLYDRNLSHGLAFRPWFLVSFVSGVVLMFSPWICASAIQALRAARRARPRASEAGGPAQPLAYRELYRRLALATFLPCFATMFVMSLFSLVFYYWILVGAVLLFPLMSELPLGRTRRALQAAYSVAMIAVFIVQTTVVPMGALLSSPDHDETGIDDSELRFGWSEVTAAVEAVLRERPDLELAANDYRTTAILSFKLGRSDIYSLSRGRDQFWYWNLHAEHLQGEVLIVTETRHRELARIDELFRQRTLVKEIPMTRFGLYIGGYRLYLATPRWNPG